LSGEQEPSQAKLIGWLRVNLAVTVVIASAVSGGVGMLISTTLAYSDATHHSIDQDRQIAQLRQEVEGSSGIRGLRQDMVDVDQRFNDLKVELGDLRRTSDSQAAADDQRNEARIAALQERVAVLEAQVHFFADRLSSPAPLGPRK
jgi:hypothetical protein